MGSYISIAIGVLLLPVLYSALILWYRPYFEKEENQKRKPLASIHEKMVLLVSEAALIRLWYAMGMKGFEDLRFTLLYLILAGMTVFCMTDVWERIVPNKILLILLFFFVIASGIHGILNLDSLAELLPSVVLGVFFCALCFGLGYLFSRKTMGAGDIKLSLLMGLYLTGEYVVGAVLYGCLAGAVYSIVQLARKRLSRKDMIPFVPFLYIGVIIRYLIG